jgi:hypothetical protein
MTGELPNVATVRGEAVKACSDLQSYFDLHANNSTSRKYLAKINFAGK